VEPWSQIVGSWEAPAEGVTAFDFGGQPDFDVTLISTAGLRFGTWSADSATIIIVWDGGSTKYLNYSMPDHWTLVLEMDAGSLALTRR
jgi:hypothetical protein